MSDQQPPPANKPAAEHTAAKTPRETILARAAKDNAGKSLLIEEARETIEKSRNLLDEIQKDHGV